MVTVYTSPTCGFCHMAMEYLKSKGVSFEARDVTTDRRAMEFVSETIGQMATPVIDIEGEIILGFDRPSIDGALREKKLI